MASGFLLRTPSTFPGSGSSCRFRSPPLLVPMSPRRRPAPLLGSLGHVSFVTQAIAELRSPTTRRPDRQLIDRIIFTLFQISPAAIMPNVMQLRMFTQSGLFQLIVFIFVIFKLFETEYVLGDEIPMGLAAPFLLIFVGTFIGAGALNAG